MDRETAAVLRDAAAEGERIIQSLGKKSISDIVQRSQYAAAVKGLREMQGEMWGGITKNLAAGMDRAAAQVAEAENLVSRTLWNAIGGPMPEYERAMHMRAREALKNYQARMDNGISLSDQVYKTQALYTGKVAQEVNRGILLSESAKQIADRVKGFISPAVPGGVSYAATRLGRTELNNAFHRAQIDQRKDNPWTEGFQWHLSGSHPKPDACNEYADKSHFKGGDAGVFKASDVPGKPHPNCLCYLTTIQVGEADFIDAFLRGDYSTHIDEQVYKYAPNVGPCR
jgi:hypothetical protein